MKRDIFAVFTCCSLIGSQALAEESTFWAKVGDWDVRFDAALGGCFMIASWPQGEIVRIGVDGVQRNGYLVLTNPDWRSLQVGNTYKLAFRFDGELPWTGVFTATKWGTSTVLEGQFDTGKFLADFAMKQTVMIYYNGRVVSRLPLTGNLAAVQSVFQCQDKANAIASGQNDPFANVGAANPPINLSPNDPFSKEAVRGASDPLSR
jgi:hypothetical protein